MPLGPYKVLGETLCAVCRIRPAVMSTMTSQPSCSRQCRVRRQNMRANYGLWPEDFWAMWEAQDGRCAMPGCRVPLAFDPLTTTTAQGVQIDHCKRTGRVRGLLCCRCNRNLGGYEAMLTLGVAEYLAG